MKIAMLSPIAWRTPPRHYGPWELVVSLLTEGLVARGVDVTLFATMDSMTRGKLSGICPTPLEETPALLPRVWDALHISSLFERAEEFDLIHNHFDYLPLTYSGRIDTPVLTTIHGFSSPGILPVYRKYNGRVYYISISDADRSPDLDYLATIHHGIDLHDFTFQADPGDYLLFLGRMHHDKGAAEAVEIARKAGKKLLMAGPIQDPEYFETRIRPHLDHGQVQYLGSVGPEKRNSLLGGALALIHPIHFAEPFGLAVVEAMACGTPVIAFSRGSMSELIIPGKTGFLINDLEEAVDAVSQIGSIDRRDCRRRVEEHFTVDRMVEDYLRVYRMILNHQTSGSHRPWGFYEILSERENHKVKRITVYPGRRISYQKHRRRREHWNIIQGEGLVILDGREIRVGEGDWVDIPVNRAHRMENRGEGDLIFIEIQKGDYFGEDDIERLEDDYGRG